MRGARHTVPRFSRLVVIIADFLYANFMHPLLSCFSKSNIVNASFLFPVERVVFGAQLRYFYGRQIHRDRIRRQESHRLRSDVLSHILA